MTAPLSPGTVYEVLVPSAEPNAANQIKRPFPARTTAAKDIHGNEDVIFSRVHGATRNGKNGSQRIAAADRGGVLLQHGAIEAPCPPPGEEDVEEDRRLKAKRRIT